MGRKKKEMKEEEVDMTKKKKDVEETIDPIIIEDVVDETSDNESDATSQPQEPEENQSEQDVEPKETLESLKKEVDAVNDKYLRLNAEFQNYRKRVEKEKSDIFKFGNEKMLVEMLPIMDNFERALSSVEEAHEEDKILSGVKMIKKSLDDFFEKHGVKKIEALHEPFDPDKHHAVMSEEHDDFEADVVLEVFQDGYMLEDKVIRHSMVKVTK